MASSSQSLDFRFDALRGFGSRLFGDRPNEAQKLARNRGGDHGLQFPRMGELAISTAESLLGLPSYVSDWLAQLFLAQKEIATDTCWKPVAPCHLNQHAPRRAIARLGDSALASRASAGMLGRNETQIGHELPRIGETGDVAELRANPLQGKGSHRAGRRTPQAVQARRAPMRKDSQELQVYRRLRRRPLLDQMRPHRLVDAISGPNVHWVRDLAGSVRGNSESKTLKSRLERTFHCPGRPAGTSKHAVQLARVQPFYGDDRDSRLWPGSAFKLPPKLHGGQRKRRHGSIPANPDGAELSSAAQTMSRRS